MGGENRTVLMVMVVGGERGVAMYTSSHQTSSCYDQYSLHDNIITHALPFS